MVFLKFLALIGITNLIVGYGWFIPAILIALPLQIINKSFAFYSSETVRCGSYVSCYGQYCIHIIN